MTACGSCAQFPASIRASAAGGWRLRLRLARAACGLRLLFVCCDDAIPRESCLVLALKTLCGFSTAEIAIRLFTNEANVHKRLQRAREILRDSAVDLISPSLDTLRSRLATVHEVLYHLFNEGYLSMHAQSWTSPRRSLRCGRSRWR